MLFRRLGIAVMVTATISAMAQSPKTVEQGNEWKAVEDSMGHSGKLQPDGTFKFSLPRTDMNVKVAEVPIQAGLALGSWIAFAGQRDHAMVMGDLVLTEDEVGPVMMKLQEEGIKETAIHNHLLHETPRVMYMHVESEGDPVKMGKAIHDALVLTKTPLSERGPAQTGNQKTEIDVAKVNSILGSSGKMNGGIFQVSVPRSEKIMDQGMEIPPSMGISTALNFQPTGNNRAVATGDFVLLPDEVNPVLKALRENGIQVTALHSHMLNDQPHLLFMHFWANDEVEKLARGLRAALDHTNSRASAPVSK